MTMQTGLVYSDRAPILKGRPISFLMCLFLIAYIAQSHLAHSLRIQQQPEPNNKLSQDQIASSLKVHVVAHAHDSLSGTHTVDEQFSGAGQ